MIETSIIIRHQFEGFHCWPDAPEEVSFLRDRHRHIFKIQLEIEVDHLDRELEFFIEQRFLKSLFASTEECNGKSCEMMGLMVIAAFNVRYNDDRSMTCEVSEDGENSGVVKYTSLL